MNLLNYLYSSICIYEYRLSPAHMSHVIFVSQWKANNRNSPTRSTCSGSRIRSGSLSCDNTNKFKNGNNRFNNKPFGVADFGDSQDDGTDSRTRSMSSSVHDLRLNAMRSQQLPPFGYFVPHQHPQHVHVNKFFPCLSFRTKILN